MSDTVLVSVVIPTRNRRTLVLRAVLTALSQSYSMLEVIVVIDGPDADTANALQTLADDRIRIVQLGDNVGGSEARNVGVREARGKWIAFLDDDDEWLRQKIEKQMTLVTPSSPACTLVSCMCLERSTAVSRVVPSRLPDLEEPLALYLCRPKGLRCVPEGFQTSTLLVSRQLLLNVPFVRGLKRGQEFAWLVMVGARSDTTVRIYPEVLSFFNGGGFTDELRVSTVPNWRSLYQWVQENRDLLGPLAYSYCIATRILGDAAFCGESLRVKLSLLRECILGGSFSVKILLLSFYISFVPPSSRRKIGKFFRSIRRQLFHCIVLLPSVWKSLLLRRTNT